MVDLPAGTPVLLAAGVELSYGRTSALRGVDIEVGRGEVLLLTGKSGSGKTSLLYCLGGVLAPDRGRVMFRDQALAALDDERLSRLRLREFGFIFQFGELVPELTIRENVSLPLQLLGRGKTEARSKASELLERLGIGPEADRRPAQVSGGQAQRAAVARALVHSPTVILADEPTGSLDTENKRLVLAELIELARSRGSTVVIATHEPEAAPLADRHVEMADGRIVKDSHNP
jgi:putative ABC transport system ATP-binding protein